MVSQIDWDEAQIILGPNRFSINELIGPQSLKSLGIKFSSESTTVLVSAVVEILRGLYLASYAKGSLFFPSNRLVDQIWHALIIETEEYERLCHRIKPFNFIHHSGIEFRDYSQSKSVEEMHNEQISWLCSYVQNFGPITPESFDLLPLAQVLGQRLKVDLTGLNIFANEATKRTGSLSQTDGANVSCMTTFIENNLRPYAENISRDPSTVQEKLVELRDFLSSRQRANNTETKRALFHGLTNTEFRQVYGVSVALGFTLWQYLVALERLERSNMWINGHAGIYAEIVDGDRWLGLGTTHLTNEGNSPLKAKFSKTNNCYFLNGRVPWVTGYRIFSNLLVGFEVDDYQKLALLEFPSKEVTRDKGCIRVEEFKLSALRGTNTVSLHFEDFVLREDDICQTRKIGQTPETPSFRSRYRYPEVGVAEEALRFCKDFLSTASSTKSRCEIERAVSRCKKRIELFVAKDVAETTPSENSGIELDAIVRDACELAVLTARGKSLVDSCPASRFYREFPLLISAVQSSELYGLRLKRICPE